MIYGEVVLHWFGNDFQGIPIPGEAWEMPILIAISLAAGSILFNILKGKYGIALLVIFVPAVGLVLSCIGAVRLAKPRSYWARYLYDRKTMEKAIERHEPPIDLQKYPPPKLRKGYAAQPPAASID